MKSSFGLLASLLFLAGCASTSHLNGKYDFDKKYYVKNVVALIAEQNGAPEDLCLNKRINKLTTNIQAVQYDAEMAFPYLIVMVKTPDESTNVWVMRFEKSGKNKFRVTDLTDLCKNECEFFYDPSDKSLSNTTSRYIKR